MDTNEKSVRRVRVYLGEDDRHEKKRLYEAVLDLATEMEMSGATAIRGFEGFGQSRRVHSARVVRPSEDLPIVIEVMDTRGRAWRFARRASALLHDSGCGGLVTIDPIEVVRYRTETEQ